MSSVSHTNASIPKKSGKPLELTKILWPEWNDAEVTAEKWGFNRPISKQVKSKEVKNAPVTVPIEETFQDEYATPLPESMRPNCSNWIKLSALYPGANIMINSRDYVYPDLITLNNHLFPSEFYRSFISSVYNLMYLGYSRPFTVEWQTSTYNSNTDTESWKPWHHIYSMCKAGEGTHNPQVNNIGKYVVRLFWMGCWRRINVDTVVPVNNMWQILLPASNNSNKLDIEIWPMILAKALLKIGSLTWTPTEELVEFDIIQCLTGWVVQKINITDLDINEKWDIVSGYTDHFAWEPDEQKKDKKGTKKSKKSKKPIKPKKEKKSKKSKKSTKGVKKVAKIKDLPPASYYITAVFKDLMQAKQEIPDITPCPSHCFLIDKTRDIPLFRDVDLCQTLPKWKLYRWVDWAIAKGIYVPLEKEQNIQYCRIVSDFRKIVSRQFEDRRPSMISEMIRINAELAEAKRKEKGSKSTKKSKKGSDKKSKKGSDKKSKKGSDTKSEKEGSKSSKSKKKGSKSSKSSKGSKGSKGTKMSKKRKNALPAVDPTIWTHFYNIYEHIDHFNIYLIPSKMKSALVISDIESKKSSGLSKSPKKDEKTHPVRIDRLKWLNGLKYSHNEPFYFFMESVNTKYIVLNLSHVGNEMPKAIPHKQYLKQLDLCQKEVCKEGLCDEGCSCQIRKVSLDKEEIEQNIWDKRTTGCLIVEEFCWRTNEIGKTLFFLNTCGSKSVILEIEPGRSVWRLWLQSCSHLVLTVLSDTEFTIGKVEDVLDKMTLESELVIKFSYNICESFGNLIKYFGTTDFKNNLQDYYKSYIPNFYLSKSNLNIMHWTFKTVLLDILEEQTPEQNKFPFIRALRILFLDPSLKFRSTYSLVKTTEIFHTEKDNDICQCVDIIKEKSKQRAATVIQALFKGNYIRKLKAKHNANNDEFLSTFETLKQIYETLFSLKRRIINGPNMMRRYLLHSNMDLIREYFPYHKDIDNVIRQYKFSGTLSNIAPNSWIFLSRFHFIVNRLIVIRLFINSDLPNYVVRVFDNDMYEEMPKHTNTPLVTGYQRNEEGYTTLSYGWTKDEPVKSASWTVTVVVRHNTEIDEVFVEKIKIETRILQDEYIPNLKNRIFRYLFSTSQNELLTFRLSISSDNVKVTLNCSVNDEVFESVTGGSNVILPIVFSHSAFRFSEMRGWSRRLVRVSSETPPSNSSSPKKRKKKKRSSVDRSSRISINSNSSIDNWLTIENSLNVLQNPSLISTINTSNPMYVLEAYVETNSWPLAQEEWDRVEERKKRDNIEKELLEPVNIGNSNNATKLETVPKKLVIEDPSWKLYVVCEKNTTLQIERDRRRVEQIKNIKRNCFQNKIERLLRGKQLRNDFINKFKYYHEELRAESFFGELENQNLSKSSNEIDNPVKSSHSEYKKEADNESLCTMCNKPLQISDLKYVVNPKSSISCLPDFRFNRVYEFDYNRRVITDEDIKNIWKLKMDDQIRFETQYQESIEKLKGFDENTKEKYQRILDHLDDIENESDEIYKELDTKRQEYIQRKTADEKLESNAIKGKLVKKKKDGKKKKK